MRFSIDRTGAESLATGHPLPVSARPVSVGVTLARTLHRTPGTSDWFTTGDAQPVPKPFRLELTLAAGTEAAARDALDELLAAGESARSLVRSDPTGGALFDAATFGTGAFGEEHRLPCDGLVSLTARPVRADLLEITVELAARSGYWTDAAGTGRHVM